MRLTTRLFAKYGHTEGCFGCAHKQAGFYDDLQHSTARRTRIYELMQNDEEEPADPEAGSPDARGRWSPSDPYSRGRWSPSEQAPFPPTLPTSARIPRLRDLRQKMAPATTSQSATA